MHFLENSPPPVTAVPKYAEFAVSRKQARKRSLEEYVRYRGRFVIIKLLGDTSGQIMKYLRHAVFEQGAVYCLETDQCYCDV